MKKPKLNNELTENACQPHLELIGSSRCIVDGLKSIIEYSPDRIKINLGKYCVVFLGDRLYIDSFSYEGAIIEGTIISLELESND